MLLFMVEALALAWGNDYLSCVRSDGTRADINMGRSALRADGVRVPPDLPRLDCLRVLPGKPIRVRPAP